MSTRQHVQKLVERARMLPPLRAAIVFPCDSDALQLGLSGSFAGYLEPTLVGPEQRIRDAANRAGLDISRLPVIDTPDNARASAQRAAALAAEGKVDALIKGAMSDPDLLGPVADPESGLRTDGRLSHAAFLDLPGESRWFLLADTLLNVAPNLAAKKDILQNTARLAVALGLPAPNVALLAAMETVTPAFPSTAEAAALRAMATEGLFPGIIVNGPMTPDVAIWGDAARTNGTRPDLAGRADVLIAPTMESAVMVLRTLTGVTGGLAAGLVLGARVPIVTHARSDPMETRMASCVMASLAAYASTTAKPTAAAIVPASSARAAA